MRYRLARRTDLAACQQLLELDRRFICSPRVAKSLPKLWRDILETDGAPRTSFIVWEDLTQPAAERVQAFSLGLFIHGAFLDAALANPEPYIAARLYEQMMAGKRPHLAMRDIAAESGSLNLVILHYVQRYYDLSHPLTVALRSLGPSSWHYSYAGYRMQRILWEVFGAPHRDNMLGWGFRDVQAFTRATPDPGHAAPYWCALERDSVKPAAFDAMSLWVFHPPAPTLKLAPAEQRVVLHALQGDTDHVVASQLGISDDAVKQAWKRIVERVSPVLPPGDAITTSPGAVRGAERRRVALDYLRQHMEELRPWVL